VQGPQGGTSIGRERDKLIQVLLVHAKKALPEDPDAHDPRARSSPQPSVRACAFGRLNAMFRRLDHAKQDRLISAARRTSQPTCTGRKIAASWDTPCRLDDERTRLSALRLFAMLVPPNGV
jgi:hypothetical protein